MAAFVYCTIDDDTQIIGEFICPIAVVYYENTDNVYTCNTLAEAQNKENRKMKKFLITISIFAALSLNVNAQDYYQYSGSSDGFFSSNSMTPGYRESTGEDLPLLPAHSENFNQPAPVGSGLLILAGLGADYAMRKRKND